MSKLEAIGAFASALFRKSQQASPVTEENQRDYPIEFNLQCLKTYQLSAHALSAQLQHTAASCRLQLQLSIHAVNTLAAAQ